MQITSEQILEDFDAVAHSVVAYYMDKPEPADPVEAVWLEICMRLVGMLDTMPDIVPWANHVQILDMGMWLTSDIKVLMQEQDHPFYQAWLEVSQQSQ